jgi:hypothetical protein
MFSPNGAKDRRRLPKEAAKLFIEAQQPDRNYPELLPRVQKSRRVGQHRGMWG